MNELTCGTGGRWYTSPTCIRVVKLCLLLGLLVAHALSREYAHQSIPYTHRTNYTNPSFRPALSLLAGHGFQTFRLSECETSSPVFEFLSMGRDRLSTEEFRAFALSDDSAPLVKSPLYQTPYPRFGGEDAIIQFPLYTTRILDVYIAAGIWKVFGVSWYALHRFYILVSVASCLAVFLIGRKLGGGFLPGFLAGLFYFASPLELDFCARSIRDISPLWFACFAVAALLHLPEKPGRSWVSYWLVALVGALSILGVGWRSDAMLIPPVILTGLVLRMLARGNSWQLTTLAVVVFLVGAGFTHVAINSLAGSTTRQSPLIGFHMAYYADSVRANILGIEATSQTARDDIQTCFTAHLEAHIRNPEAKPFAYLDGDYGRTCATMFFRRFTDNPYPYVSGFPNFYVDAIRSTQFLALPVNRDWYPPPLPRPDFRLYRWAWKVAHALNFVVLWLFVIGALTGLVIGKEPALSAWLLLFTGYHSAALFCVLPECKHAGLLVLPVVVFAGLGIVYPLRLLGGRAAVTLAGAGKRVRVVLIVGALLAVSWLVACQAAYSYSVSRRAEYVAEIQKRKDHSTVANHLIKGPHLFSVSIPADMSSYRMDGYLLRIQAGHGPASLCCKQVRLYNPKMIGSVYTTNHDLQRDREQFFFVTCVQTGPVGDPRSLICTALIRGDADIKECWKMELSSWKYGPLCTVFSPGPVSAGSPPITGPSCHIVHCGIVPVTRQGLNVAEHLEFYPSDLSACTCFERNACTLEPSDWKPIGGTFSRDSTDRMVRLTTRPEYGSYAIESPRIVAPITGHYAVKLSYRRVNGALGLGVLHPLRDRWIQLAYEDASGDERTCVVVVYLEAGQSASLIVLNGSSTGKPSVVDLGFLEMYYLPAEDWGLPYIEQHP